MADGSARLDAATRRLVLLHVRTFEELELLLLLDRDRTRYWSATAAAVPLGVTETAARQACEALASRNLLEVRLGEDVLYRLDPTGAAADGVRRVLDAVRQHRVAVINTIASTTTAAADFADAFRLTRRREDG
jgi:hypothetical protein